MARSLADPAIDDRVGVLLNAALIEVNFRQLGCGLKRGIIVRSRFPRHALCLGNVTATQNTLLRILRHVRDLAFVFSGRTHIDQWFAGLALRKRFFGKGPNLLVEAFLRPRIINLRMLWAISGHW